MEKCLGWNGNNVFVTKRKQGITKLSYFAAFHKSSINLKLKYETLKLYINFLVLWIIGSNR